MPTTTVNTNGDTCSQRAGGKACNALRLSRASLSEALQAVVHEKVEDGVRVDGDQPHGEGEYVVKVVQGKEVAGRMVPVDHQHEDGRD